MPIELATDQAAADGSAKPKSRRGRKPRSVPKHVETAQRVENLQLALKAAHEEHRQAALRRASIVGAACIRAIEADGPPELRKALVIWLRRTVTKPVERAEIAPLLLGDQA